MIYARGIWYHPPKHLSYWGSMSNQTLTWQLPKYKIKTAHRIFCCIQQVKEGGSCVNCPPPEVAASSTLPALGLVILTLQAKLAHLDWNRGEQRDKQLNRQVFEGWHHQHYGGSYQQLQYLPLTQLFAEPSIALCPQPSRQVKRVHWNKCHSNNLITSHWASLLVWVI